MLVTYQRLSSCSEYLTGYLKSIKNTQAEVKVTLSEIKKNLYCRFYRDPTVRGRKLGFKSTIWDIRKK